jgi:thiol-disulfide isomerase/thioredoxin
MFQISMDNMMKNILIALTAAMLAGSAGLVGCVGEKRIGGDRVKVGDPVPAFTVAGGSAEGGKTFSQADFVDKRSMIVFFATWCPDCRRELPIVYEAWLELSQRPDFQFVAVSREEKAGDVAAYWNSATPATVPPKPSFVAMPWWLDPDGSAFRTFAESTIPRVYLVNTRGEIASVAIETFEFTADKLVELIEGLK